MAIDKITNAPTPNEQIDKINEIIDKKLENTATGNNGLTIGGTASTTGGSTNVGMSSMASKSYSTAIGYNSQAKGNYSTTVGWNAMATKQNAIQLGWGTNTTENSLSVGFYNKNNYPMLDGTTGKIPSDRIKCDGQTITVNGNGELTSTGGGSSTDVQINGTTITANNVANIRTNGTYNASSNKIATMSDLPTVPTNVSAFTNDAGYTTNVGTVTKVNNTTPDSNGNVSITIPSAVTESTVSSWGFTKNTGTITGITMNGASKGTSGVVNLGTVITSHQDISGKANTDLSNCTKPYVTLAYHNGADWYRVWSDGFIEQGGIKYGTSSSNSTKITLNKAMTSTDYICIAHAHYSSAVTNTANIGGQTCCRYNGTVVGKTKTNFTIQSGQADYAWYVAGY